MIIGNLISIGNHYGRGGGSEPAIVLYVMGQSNSAGFKAPIEDLVGTDYEGEFNNVFIWNGSACEKMNASGTNNNQYPNVDGGRNGNFGQEVSMCKDLADATGRTVYLFKYSIGATGLISAPPHGTWNTSVEDGLYDAVREEIALFNAWVTSNIPDHVKSTVIWFQGENDASSIGFDPYLVEEENFVIGIRSAIDSTQFVNWISCEICENLGENRVNLNKVKRILAGYNPAVRTKNTSSYEWGDDNNHLTSTGQIALGQDLAVDISENIEGDTIDTFLGVPWEVNLITANNGFVRLGNSYTGNGVQNNGKCYSKRVLPNNSDGYAEYTVPVGFASVGLHIFGLADDASDGAGTEAYFDVCVIVDFPDSSMTPYASGVSEGGAIGLTEGDVIRIAIENGVILLKKNGITVHTYSITQSKDYAVKLGTRSAYANIPKFDNVVMQSDARLKLSPLATVDLTGH